MIRTIFFLMLGAATLTVHAHRIAPVPPFAEGRKPASCLAGGVDFGANNAQKVVLGPGRNLLMNPSLESGLRYFSPPRGHEYAGDFPLALCDKDARSGTRSLCVTWASGPVGTLGIPVHTGKDYTFSCYIKRTDGKAPLLNHTVTCRLLKSAAQTKGELSILLKRCGKPENGWTRYAGTFRPPSPILTLQFWPQNNLLYDDFQLELGREVTPYAGNPVGMEFQSGSPENAILDSARNVKTFLLLRGPAGIPARCRIVDSDFFGQRRDLGEFQFTFDRSGEHRLSLPESRTFTDGIHVLEVKFDSDHLPAFTDYVRFAKFRYASNHRKNRTLHGQRCAGRLYRNERFARLWTIFGFSTFPYNKVPYPYSRDVPVGLAANSVEDYAFLKKYNIVDWGSALFHHPWGTDETWLNGVKIEENGIPVMKLKHYSPALLKRLEEEAAKLAESRPHVTLWQSDTEPICNWQTLKEGNYPEYARLQLALTRGLKRGNPSCEHMPMGHYTMYQEGRDQVIAFLRAAKEEDPTVHYRFIEIHTYRPFPELPDTDSDIAKFLEGLSGIGYPDIRVRLGEGAYFYPLIVKEYNIAPWESTQNKDRFQCMTILSYDLGWGERVGAAMVLRTMLAAYKYTPRVVQMLPWLIHTVDEQTPLAWSIANANLSNLLGDSTFRRDIRFAPDSRAYLFDDGHGQTVAVLWKFREEMDRGKQAGVPVTLDLGDTKMEIIDMMGNLSPARRIHGRTTIPLSNFPVFLRVASADSAALENAILHAELPDDTTRPPLHATLRLKSRTALAVELTNPLSRSQDAELSIDGSPFREIHLKAGEKLVLPVVRTEAIPFDRYSDVSVRLTFRLNDRIYRERLHTRAIAVTRVPSTFAFQDPRAWRTLPAVRIPYYHKLYASNPLKDRGDFHAFARFAWNGDGLYMNFEVYDNQLILPPEDLPPAKCWIYETIQLYFDAYGDAREKLKSNAVGYGEDDFSYELIPRDEKTLQIYRRDAPDHQLTGGVVGGFQANQVVPDIPSVFSYYNQQVRFYRVKFPARHLMPMPLKAGKTAGLGIMIWDQDAANPQEPVKAVLQNVNPLLGTPFRSPHLYPQILLAE